MSSSSYREDFAQFVKKDAIFGAKKEHYSSRLEIDIEALVKNLSLKSPKGWVRSPTKPTKYRDKSARCMSPKCCPVELFTQMATA
ncbi:hypothetical protein AAC387_Pa10g0414 [Persea americana]